MSTYASKIINGSKIIVIASLLGSIFSYLLRLILARNLTPEEFGLVYSVIAILGVAAIFVTMGLGESLVNYISKYRTKQETGKIKNIILKTSKYQFLISSTVCFLLILFSKSIAENYLGLVEARVLIILIGISLLLSPLDIVITSIFKAYQKFYIIGLINSGKVIVLFILTALFLKYELGPFGAILPYVLIYIFWIVILLPKVLKLIKFKQTRTKKILHVRKKIFGFGIPLLFAGLASSLLTYSDILILTSISGLAAVGFYNIAIPIASIIMIIGHTMNAVLFPFFAELWHSKQKKILEIGVKKINTYLLLFSLPIFSLLVIFTEQIITILFGSQYLVASIAAKILLIGAIFHILGTVTNTILKSLGKTISIAKITFIGALVNILLNLIIIRYYSYNGAAVATALSFAIMYMLSIYHVRKEMAYLFPTKKAIVFSLSSVLCVLTVFLIKSILTNIYLKIVLGGIGGILTYIITVLIFKGITKEEILLFLKQAGLNKL
jgi:O-antigen/teichoic acid export membrane protein